MWLEINSLFFGAIADLIHAHNKQMREKAIEEYTESEYENEDE